MQRIVGAPPAARAAVGARRGGRGEAETSQGRVARPPSPVAISDACPGKPTGQIREHTDRNGVVSYSVRFRGRGYPTERIPLGRSDEGMNRAVPNTRRG